MFFAFTFLFITLQLVAMHTEVRRRRVTTLERKAARGESA
jgi:heme exporter protein C